MPTASRSATTRFRTSPASNGPDALAEAELKLTQTVLTYARHLQAGRFPYNRVSNNNIELPQMPPDMAAVLTKVADAGDAGKALDEFSPPHESYKALKKALAELRGKTGSGGAARSPTGRCSSSIPRPRWKTRACRSCASGSGSPAIPPTSNTTPSSPRR